MKLDTRNLGALMAELRGVSAQKPLIIKDGKMELCGEAEFTVTEDGAVLDFTPKVAKKRRARK